MGAVKHNLVWSLVATLAIAAAVALLVVSLQQAPAALGSRTGGAVWPPAITDRSSAAGLDATGSSSVAPACSAPLGGETGPDEGKIRQMISYTTIPDRKDTLDRNPVLLENSNARVPSYSELMTFLKKDDTVRNKYDSPNFTCANFVVEMQHHAEGAGIQCGYAGLNFRGKDTGHAISVFPTTDQGLVYVDATGGKLIITKGLKEGAPYYNMGVISKLTTYW